MAEGYDCKCFLCSGKLSNSRILPCLHSFCLECLEKHLSEEVIKDKISCPRCEALFDVPENGLKGMKKNQFYDCLTMFMESGKLCDCCSTKSAEKVCIECEQCYCLNCSSMHKKMTSSINHIMSDLKPPTKMSRNVDSNYEINFKKVEVFCEDCVLSLSLENYATNHGGHKMKLLSALLNEKQQKLKNLIAARDARKQLISQAKDQSDATVSKSKTDIDVIKEQIKNRSNELVQLINDHKSLLLNQIDDEGTKFSQSVNALKEQLDGLEAIVAGEVSGYGGILSNLNVVNVVETSINETVDTSAIPTLSTVFNPSFTPTTNEQILPVTNSVGTLQMS